MSPIPKKSGCYSRRTLVWGVHQWCHWHSSSLGAHTDHCGSWRRGAPPRSPPLQDWLPELPPGCSVNMIALGVTHGNWTTGWYNPLNLINISSRVWFCNGGHILVSSPDPISHKEKWYGEPSQISWASAHFCDSVTWQHIADNPLRKKYAYSNRDDTVVKKVLRNNFAKSLVLLLLANNPNKFNFGHHTASRREVRVGWACD